MTSVRQAAGEYLRIEAPTTLRSIGAEVGHPAGSTRTVLRRLDQTHREWFSGSLLPSSSPPVTWRLWGSAYLAAFSTRLVSTCSILSGSA